MEDLAPEDIVDEPSGLTAGSLAPGSRLGRYELLLAIAQGGMARVWAARQQGQRGFSKTVAIKTILPQLADDAEFERMFLDEARIAAGVHHPNVTEIYELGEEGRVLYLAMEWVNGDSLVHVLRGIKGNVAQPIDVRVAARIVADACAGLHAAHELTDDDGRVLNVVHRDVSPHNILVSAEGMVKVTDFGVARAYGQSQQATLAGQMKGKVAYMAPEYIGGTAFDRRADVFGMGCVLYEATVGQQPFRGGNDPQVMHAVLRGAYDHPSKIIKMFPAELATIIDHALAAEPRMRFATAEHMRVALEEWLAKTGSIVTPTQIGMLVRQRLGPTLDRRRDRVKAAVSTLQGGNHDGSQPGAHATAPIGHTPSGAVTRPPAPASRSGVVRAPPPRPAAGAPPPLPRSQQPSQPWAQPLAAQPGIAPAAPVVPFPPVALAPPSWAPTGHSAPQMAPSSGAMPYVLAAAAGIVFVAAAGVAVFVWSRSHLSGGSRSAPSAAATVASPPARPSAAPAATRSATAVISTVATTSPEPSAASIAGPITTREPAATAVVAASPSPPASAVVIDVDAPRPQPARPTWTAVPVAQPPAPALPGGALRKPALPPNPY
jgi:serine/threonine-protein kinase